MEGLRQVLSSVSPERRSARAAFSFGGLHCVVHSHRRHLMFMTGLAIFTGAALLLAKLRRRWMLRALDHDLALDVAVSAATLIAHWGTFSGVMGATIAGLLDQRGDVHRQAAVRLHPGKRLLPGHLPARHLAAPHPARPGEGYLAGASALLEVLHARHLHRDHRPHHRPRLRRASPLGYARGTAKPIRRP